MGDVELYGTILGRTPPWMVAKVDLDVQGRQVVVHVEAGALHQRERHVRDLLLRDLRRLRRNRHDPGQHLSDGTALKVRESVRQAKRLG